VKDEVIWITKNGVHIPITNNYMNNKIRGKSETFDTIDANTRDEFEKKRKAYVEQNLAFSEKESKDKTMGKIKAILDNKIVGTLEYEINKYGQTEVHFIWVNNDYRRYGIGTKLYNEIQSKTPNQDLLIKEFTGEGKKLLENIGVITKQDKNGYYVRINKGGNK